MDNHNKNSPWYKLGKKYGFPNISWTEKVTNKIIATPINTISNIFYLLSSYLCRNNPIIASSLFFVGISSGLYHCTVIYPFQVLDLFSMKVLFSIMIYQQLQLHYLFLYLLLFINTVCFYLLIKYKINIQYSSIINIIFIIFTIKKFTLYTILSLLFLFGGISCSFIDLRYKFKYGHCLWHLLSGLSVYFWNKQI